MITGHHIFPDSEWQRCTPENAGFSPTKLADAKANLDAQQRDYRVVIVRDGKGLTEWNRGLDAANQQHAFDMDAADGVIDGRSFGAPVAQAGYPQAYGQPAYGMAAAPMYGAQPMYHGGHYGGKYKYKKHKHGKKFK